ncbi:hypothetical protein ABXV18_21550 [Vibrio owensii]|uniref:hypothetical protein n=1 Tax=Vibrio owensii TaxID=696485 RepID=UPI0033929131
MTKIIKNTVYLNGNVIISTLVTLYTIRVLLNTLGDLEYGLLNLISGVVAFLSFLNGSMAISTQRNLTFCLQKTKKEFSIVFSNSLFIHLIMATLIGIVCFILKGYLIGDLLTIPEGKIDEANILYIVTVLTMCITIISVPYESILSAYEKFWLVSWLNIIASIARLLAALYISNIESNRLVYYALLTLLISFIVALYKYYYCKVKYEGLNFKIRLINFSCSINLLKFVGWNTFGALCGVVRIQGLGILINMFFSLTINAAYAIAIQVNSKLKELSLSVTRAFNPKIVRSESIGDREAMLGLSLDSSRLSLYLFSFLAIPLIINLEYVFDLWLISYPKEAKTFVVLFVVLSLVNLTTIGLQTAIQAFGDIKLYQITIGSILLFTLPIAYFLLKYEYPYYSILVVSIILEIISCILRLVLLKVKTGLNIRLYIIGIFKVLGVILTSYLLSASLLNILFASSLLGAVLMSLLAIFLNVCLGYLFLLTPEQKKSLKNIC